MIHSTLYNQLMCTARKIFNVTPNFTFKIKALTALIDGKAYRLLPSRKKYLAHLRFGRNAILTYIYISIYDLLANLLMHPVLCHGTPWVYVITSSSVNLPASFRKLDSAPATGWTHCSDAFLWCIVLLGNLQPSLTASWSTSAVFAAVKSLNTAPLRPASW